MPQIRVHDKDFEPYIDSAALQQEVRRLSEEINRDYAGKKPLFIAILNGSFMFAADVFRYVNIEAEICFIKLASYKGTKSSGHVVTAIGLDTDLIGRHLIILEDIVDTGKTLNAFLPQLHHQSPASLKIAALLHKPAATKFPVTIDYLGFTIPDKFVLGYGLDYDGLGRNMPEIYKLVE
jgi:hypoxanthine phosphoribosyltransferase